MGSNGPKPAVSSVIIETFGKFSRLKIRITLFFARFAETVVGPAVRGQLSTEAQNGETIP
jgi:hypothetical protein